jgi:hypothetical protein
MNNNNFQSVPFSIIFQFFGDWYTGKYPNERMGQAFLNKFVIGKDDELFYEKDTKKTEQIILDKYGYQYEPDRLE